MYIVRMKLVDDMMDDSSEDLLKRMEQDQREYVRRQRLGHAMPGTCFNMQTADDLMLWFQNSHDVDATCEILEEIQRGGVDKDLSIRLYSHVVRLFQTSKEEFVCVGCLHVINDMLNYIQMPEEDARWLIDEDRSFNNTSRAYKLAKSNVVCKVVISATSTHTTDSIYSWMTSVIQGGDDEYIDLLAFAVGSQEVAITERIRKLFHDYMSANPKSDAAAEMAVSLARIKDRFVLPFVLEALNNKPGDPYIEAGVLLESEPEAHKLLELLCRKSRDYKNKVEELRRQQ